MPSLFETSAECCAEASLSSSTLPVTVETPAQQWSYAAKFERSAAQLRVRGASAVIRIKLHVSTGHVGVGCLNKTRKQFIDEVLIRDDSSHPYVDVVVPDLRDAGPLVVRNASASGVSRMTIFDVECFAFDCQSRRGREPSMTEPVPVPGWSRYYGTDGDTLVERVRVREFDGLVEPVIVRWVDGMTIRVLPRDQLSRAIYVSGTYEPNTLVVLHALLKEGDVFLDVGANAGVMSLAASAWVGVTGRVYALEPSEREFSRLVDNLRRNRIPNVEPVRLAASSVTGRATLRVASDAFGGLNTLGDRFAYTGVDVARLETVETSTFDDFVERRSISRVAVIKLDVEGGEAAALRGGTAVLREHRPAIVAEIVSKALYANGSSPEEVEAMLREAGYLLYSIDDATALPTRLENLQVDEQNLLALPEERAGALLKRDTFRALRQHQRRRLLVRSVS